MGPRRDVELRDNSGPTRLHHSAAHGLPELEQNVVAGGSPLAAGRGAVNAGMPRCALGQRRCGARQKLVGSRQSAREQPKSSLDNTTWRKPPLGVRKAPAAGLNR